MDTAAGVGSEPIHVGGNVYLAGPYKGAPISAVVITPAVAGPFDLGNVVVRAPLEVNPETAQITAKSDPIPTILKGIPLKLRSVAIQVTRQFTLNPTNCEAMALTASSVSDGASARPPTASRSATAGPAFKPKLRLQLKGGTKRGDHPALKAVLTFAKTAKPTWRGSRSACRTPSSSTRATSARSAPGCSAERRQRRLPQGSVYGHVKAGPRCSNSRCTAPSICAPTANKLPDLVADLNGQIDIALGGVDTTKRTASGTPSKSVPDAPVSQLRARNEGRQEGPPGQNTENLCAKAQKASARLVAQNGKVAQLSPKIAVQCKKKHKRAAEKSSGRHAAKRSQAQVASLLRRLHTGW